MERLHRRLVRRLVVADERHDDVASTRVGLAVDDDDVAVEDAGLDHRFALDPKEEVGITTEGLGNGDPLLDLLLGEQRSAGGDPAEERHERGGLRGGRLGATPADELDGAGLRGIAAEQTGALEVCEVRVNSRR